MICPVAPEPQQRDRYESPYAQMNLLEEGQTLGERLAGACALAVEHTGSVGLHRAHSEEWETTNSTYVVVGPLPLEVAEVVVVGSKDKNPWWVEGNASGRERGNVCEDW